MRHFSKLFLVYFCYSENVPSSYVPVPDQDDLDLAGSYSCCTHLDQLLSFSSCFEITRHQLCLTSMNSIWPTTFFHHLVSLLWWASCWCSDCSNTYSKSYSMHYFKTMAGFCLLAHSLNCHFLRFWCSHLLYSSLDALCWKMALQLDQKNIILQVIGESFFCWRIVDYPMDHVVTNHYSFRSYLSASRANYHFSAQTSQNQYPPQIYLLACHTRWYHSRRHLSLRQVAYLYFMMLRQKRYDYFPWVFVFQPSHLASLSFCCFDSRFYRCVDTEVSLIQIDSNGWCCRRYSQMSDLLEEISCCIQATISTNCQVDFDSLHSIMSYFYLMLRACFQLFFGYACYSSSSIRSGHSHFYLFFLA